MGLTAWKGDIVRKGDVGIAKNYLTEQEISDLNLIATQYLDFAEFQARRHQPMYMKDWVQRLDDFLQVNRLNILETDGKISAQQAKEIAEAEYEKFSGRRRLEQDQRESDFDKLVKRIEEKTRK